EADHIADQVTRSPQASSPALTPPSADIDQSEARRKSASLPDTASPALNQTLNSPGQPLDTQTRDFMEPRLGQDLGGVRVHTGGGASESAKGLNARALTVGSDIVFGAGQYEPGTSSGDHLLAHELAHVVQQRAGGSAQPFLQRVPLPGFTQGAHDTCQPASMLSALIIQDRERADPANPNANMVGICNAALIYLHQNREALITRWSSGGADGVRRFNDSVSTVTRIRDALRPSGSTVSQSHYEDLAVILSEFGDSSDSIMRHLSLAPSSAEQLLESMDAIFGSPLMTGLMPGQVNQIEWYVRTTATNATTGQPYPTTGYHMFLIGRQQTGEWYLSDQGRNPAFEITAPDLATLRQNMVSAEASGRSWIITNPTMRRIPLTWSGVHRVGGQDFTRPHRQLAAPGTFLAEVDAGWTVTGERVSTWDFVGIAYSQADARALFPSTGNGHGFLVGEMPAGVFNVWKTNPVSTDNLAATEIDRGDSGGGLLVRSPNVFMHAWLHLRTSTSSLSSMTSFMVY
ncbi:MAG TPA: DUF4157 domain-containing protein, partial [Blastocatellia bacterium]|nr:DUF4157 domain-containing protein [Blastocatellia bacterium]